MIAVDTHLLVRHPTQDDPLQAAKVARLWAGAAADVELILLTDIVPCETAWVLTRLYGVKRADFVAASEQVLADAQFVFHHRPELQAALARAAGCRRPTLSRRASGRRPDSPGCDRAIFREISDDWADAAGTRAAGGGAAARACHALRGPLPRQVAAGDAGRRRDAGLSTPARPEVAPLPLEKCAIALAAGPRWRFDRGVTGG